MVTHPSSTARTPVRPGESVAKRLLVVGTVLLVGMIQTTQASQSEGGARAAADTTAPIVRTVDIQGNRQFSAGTLKENIRTRPNRRVLGIPGLTWWRWVHQLGSADWMWERLGTALRSGGEPPAYIDSTTVGGDAERLELFYRQRGFQDAAVSYRVEPREEDNRVRVVFEIEPGSATYLRRVQYAGLDSLRTGQKQRLVQGTVFEAGSVSLKDTLSVRVQEQRYREPMLLEERRRILTFLQNEGYAAVSRDSVRAVVYRVAPDSFDVTLRVQTGPRYRFGDVRFEVTGPEDAPPRSDTVDLTADTTGGEAPRVVSRIVDERHLDPTIVRRSLRFTPGAYYDQSAVQATKRRLDGTGVFAFTNLSPQYDDAVLNDTTGTPYLPLQINAQTRQRHRLQAETFALQRESVGASEAGVRLNEFGVGLSGTYENVNAFGGGETFRLRTSASVATGLDSLLISSNQFEGSASLVLPYLIRPFQSLDRAFDLSNARTRISLTGLTALRSDLGLRIRSRLNARLRLEMDHTPTQSSLVDVMDLSLSNPDTLDQFSKKFLRRVFGRGGENVQDPVQRQQILEDYTQPQVNTALRYTFRDATAGPMRRRSGHIYEVSGEVGNTLPLLVDRFVSTPGSLDYSLPSLFGGAGGLTGRLLYRPYLRTSVDLRRYVPLGAGTTLGLKFFGGWAHPTAGPTVVPFDRRFFSGGANSVRGWRLRELGPGEGLPADTTAAVPESPSNILGGDVKLESSIELRTTLLQSVLAARWIGATFLDVGNVWFGPRNRGFGRVDEDRDDTNVRRDGRDGRFDGPEALLDVGVGSGAGLRLEWPYLIVRLDLAYRLHDPSPRNDDVFGENFSGPLLHFGIGHSF
ncbi:BamA/TamA family outer membrane protein [Salinibacter grassmerensis]|uniref:BamA/TamA family outer membrane protein n=1 Tax=Salinibacter grassmerensis TaxID=3040353 RepID=UPI0021E8338B|nr:BamA/TamA family outer membrane protein [Salinibacter grassmerensis]